MKKLALMAIATLTTITATFPAWSAPVPAENIRADLCKAIIVDYDRDVVTIMDVNGYTWEWAGVDDTDPGDFYNVVFYDNGTANIEDDEILVMWYERPDLWK